MMPGCVRFVLKVVVGLVAFWVGFRLLLAWAGASEFATRIGMVAAEQWALTTLGPPLLGFLAFESAVVTSALLDWREAKLSLATRNEAWAAAHVTVFLRVYRRVRWIGSGVRVAWRRRQVARKLADTENDGYVVLDPTKPWDGQVIDPVEDKKRAA